MYIRFTGYAFLLVFKANSTIAAVLTPENVLDLCHPGPVAGTYFISPERLAQAVVEEANARKYIRQAQGGPVAVDDIYAVMNTPEDAIVRGTPPNPAATRPFGPSLDLAKDAGALAARNAIASELEDPRLVALVEDNELNGGDGLTYRLVMPKPTESFSVETLMLFAPGSPRIQCDTGGKSLPDPPAPILQQPEESASGKLIDVFRLRGEVSDLNFPQQDLRDLSSATFSLTNDREASSKTVSVNGVLGFSAVDLYHNMSGTENAREWDAIPFISFKSRRVDHDDDGSGQDDDIGVFAPGLLGVNRVENCMYSVHSRLEGTWIDDYEQNSDQLKARLYIDPAFALSECPKRREEGISARNPAPRRLSQADPDLGAGYLFGSYLRPIAGLLQFRPDLTLIGDMTKVLDEGDNEALAGVDNYYGLGGELSPDAIIAEGLTSSPLEDLTLSAGLRNLWLLGDIDDNDLKRWFVEMSYVPSRFPYIGTSISYVNGQDSDTLQKEDVISLNFTLRY